MKNGHSQYPKAVLPIIALFLVSTCGPWAWFNIHPREYPVSIRFEQRTNIESFQFLTEAVTPQAIETLATTNLINGTFLRENRERFTVFAADWHGKESKEMSVIAHTPDVCWVGTGAKPADLGQPENTEISFDSGAITFECRVFKMGENQPLEMTIWCALTSGQVITEGGRFSTDYADEWDRKTKILQTTRVRSMNIFAQAIKHRLRATGEKQFVRLSTSVDGDWRITLIRLKNFAQKWLKPKVSKVATGN